MNKVVRYVQQPLLSIMIPTTTDRRDLFMNLCLELEFQRENFYKEVEILFMEDDKEISVGLKRQMLLDESIGKFVVGFDSDDFPAKTYISDILNAIRENPKVDHIGFIEDCDIDGQKSKSIFSIKNKSWDEKEEGYDQVRCANPKSVIRRSKAIKIGFKDLRFGEDRLFSEAVTPILESEIFIDKVLYYYRYKSTPHNERYGITH